MEIKYVKPKEILPLKIKAIEEYVCKLRPFGDNTIVINLVKKPHIWNRLWYYIFLGWRFEKCEE